MLTTDTVTRDALAVLQPGFTGTDAPDWLLRRLSEGLGSVALFSRNISSPEQLALLTARLRSEVPEVIVAADEEGGDVTRLEARRGSSFPGNHALGAVDDPELTQAVARELGRAPRRAAGSTSTGRRPPTSTPTRATRSSACGPSGPSPRWWPGTPRPTSRASSRPGWPPAPSTSPATATPRSTRTTTCRAVDADLDHALRP